MKGSRYAVMVGVLVLVAAGIAAAALPSIISGTVTNTDTALAVGGAKVWVQGGTAVSAAKNGSYVLTVPAGYVTLCSVSTGYTATCKPQFNALSGQEMTRNFRLAPK